MKRSKDKKHKRKRIKKGWGKRLEKEGEITVLFQTKTLNKLCHCYKVVIFRSNKLNILMKGGGGRRWREGDDIKRTCLIPYNKDTIVHSKLDNSIL